MSSPNYFRAQAPMDIKAGEFFVVDLATANVLLESQKDSKVFDTPTASLPPSADLVNHPSHYNQGKIEVIEFIEDQRLGYHLGNTVKYIARAGRKDPNKEVGDLEKAAWYLKRRIEVLKAEREKREAVRPNNMVRSK